MRSCTFVGRERSLIAYQFAPLHVDVLQNVFPLALCFQLTVLLVQLQSCPSVLDRIVSPARLNVLVQNYPGQESQGDLAVSVRQVVDIDRV